MSKFFNELKSYQSIPRELVFDDTLSDRARFVYVFMSCKPEGWDFFLEPMAKEIKYSVDTLRKYISELVASGWLEKGEQENENGRFGATSYILKATKITDTENFRHGKKPTQDNRDYKDKQDYKEKDKEKSLSKKTTNDELFETCWIAYRRKGKKGKAYPYWKKLTDNEQQSVLPHIKAYVQAKELQYQQDFERYLRDKTFQSIVISKNTVVYDPERSQSNEYRPTCDVTLMWNDYYKAFIYVGYWDGHIPDGYTDDNRPDGATVMLNNGRGNVKWSKEKKQWIKE